MEAVERALAELWKQTAGDDQAGNEEAVLRVRAADLMVFLADESALGETHKTISELASIHPCRALLMAGERTAAARDIEMYVSAFRQSKKRSGLGQLCCEEVTLTARGHFASELPSAAIPLLVPDLPVFLWWRDVMGVDDKIFKLLSRAADRLVIDSADFQNPYSDLVAVARLFNREYGEPLAISDMNWSRLTSWRAMLANFFDVQDYRTILDRLGYVRIDYVSQNSAIQAPTQPLLIAGWLASRLGWKIIKEPQERRLNEGLCFDFMKDSRVIKLELKAVQRPAIKTGRLVQVKLKSVREEAASFLVNRSEDGLHLETRAELNGRSHAGRVMPIRNRSTAELLAREMEILCADVVYQESLTTAADIVNAA